MYLNKSIKQEPIDDEDKSTLEDVKQVHKSIKQEPIDDDDKATLDDDNVNPKLKIENVLNHMASKLEVIIKEEKDENYGNAVKLNDIRCSSNADFSLSCGIDDFKTPEFTSSHSIETPCICMACDLKFSEKAQLTNHMFQHIQKKPFPCSVCSMGFDNSRAIADHMNIHYGYRTDCSYCGKIFEDRNNILSHFSICSPEKVQGRLYCDICSEQFIDEGSVIKHMLTHTQEKSYICTICGECITTKRELKVHMRKHTKGMPYKCSTCGKCFATRHEVKKHAKIAHTIGQPFSCKICGTKFKLEQYMKRHMNRH